MKNQSGLFQAAAVSGLGVELAFSVGFFTWLGTWADESWGSKPWMTLAGFVLGLVLAVIMLKKTIERLNAP